MNKGDLVMIVELAKMARLIRLIETLAAGPLWLVEFADGSRAEWVVPEDPDDLGLGDVVTAGGAWPVW
jgi:hypothetical protein